MKQKRKVKSLLPQEGFSNGRFLTILLLVLSAILCIGSVSFLAHSVGAIDVNEDGLDDSDRVVTVIFNGGAYGTISGQAEYPNLLPGYSKYPDAPQVKSNNKYGFSGWDSEYPAGEVIPLENYTLIFTAQYFSDLNGNNKDDNSERVAFTFNAGEHGNILGSSVTPKEFLPGYNLYPRAPSVTADADYGFSGWDPTYPGSMTIIPLNNPTLEYTAQYFKDENHNGQDDENEHKYTITVNYEFVKNGIHTQATGSYVNSGCLSGISYNITIPSIQYYNPEPSELYILITGRNVTTTVTYYPENDSNRNNISDEEEHLQEITEFDYTGIDNSQEVLYSMQFIDPLDVQKIVNNIYMSGSSLYITPKPVIVNSRNNPTNIVGTGLYSHILGGEENEVYSDNITLIAGKGNKVRQGNENASILGGFGNIINQGEVGGNPVVLIGGSSNVLGTNHKENVFIGGENNRAVDTPGTTNNVFFLGGLHNIVAGSENLIVGGKEVSAFGLDNMFVYSNAASYWPDTGNAFYLNMIGGVGINTGGIDGLAVAGAVSFGNINIKNKRCTNDNLGVKGTYKGCLVGCTEVSKNSSEKWEMLDQGLKCDTICSENSDYCLFSDSIEGVINDDSEAQCTTGVVDTENAHLCIEGALGSYKGVVFETSLIDSNDSCPNGQNICVYQCNPGFHLTGDKMSGKVKCYSDCKLPWDETKTIKHNETVIGYNVDDVSCSNDVYVFPLATEIINKGQPGPTYTVGNITRNGVTYYNRAKYGKSYESCGNYDHKKILICYNGELYLTKDGKRDTTTTTGMAAKYNHESCNLYDYRCNTGVYNLTQQEIRNTMNDEPQNNGSWIVADRSRLQGNRGQYELCLDYNANSDKETCTTGNISNPYHYKFVKCQDGYSLIDGKCMKKCSLTGSDGNSKLYTHGSVATGYEVSSVPCPGVCTGVQLACDDGTWKLNGNAVSGYYYNYCKSQEHECGSDYKITTEQKNEWEARGNYAGCDNYDLNCNKDTKRKLVSCKTGNHQKPGTSYCEDNISHESCSQSGGPENSSYTVENVEVTWVGERNTGHWSTPAKCKWTCNSGYVTGADNNSCINPACGEDPKTCLDSGAVMNVVTDNEAGAVWTCEGKFCTYCNTGAGYHDVNNGGVLSCEKNIHGLCGSEHYNCDVGMKNDRNDDIGAGYIWECLGDPETDENLKDVCHECKDNATWNSGTNMCQCDDGYVEDGNECIKQSGKCSLTHFECEEGTSSENMTGSVKWTWKCLDKDCYECRADQGYIDDGNNGCESCMKVSLSISNITGCNVWFNVQGNTGSEPPHYFTGNLFNTYFSLRYSKNGVDYTRRSHIENWSGINNMVKLFNNNETGNIYLKLRNESKGCFGKVKSGYATTQVCTASSPCSSCVNGRTFYNGNCLNWQFSGFYSETGNLLMNFKNWGKAIASVGKYCNSFSTTDCELDDDAFPNPISGCPDSFYYIPTWNGNITYQSTIRQNFINNGVTDNITAYVPIQFFGSRCKLTLEKQFIPRTWGSVALLHVIDSQLYTNTSCCGTTNCY